jgi:hypothetical protein
VTKKDKTVIEGKDSVLKQRGEAAVEVKVDSGGGPGRSRRPLRLGSIPVGM